MESIHTFINFIHEFNWLSVMLRIILAVIVGNVGLEVTTLTKNDFDRVKKELSSSEGICYIIQ